MWWRPTRNDARRAFGLENSSPMVRPAPPPPRRPDAPNRRPESGGTISPWSSKATEFRRICGLHRSVGSRGSSRFGSRPTIPRAPSPCRSIRARQLQASGPDSMTGDQVVFAKTRAFHPIQPRAPRKMTRVPVLAQGRRRLVAAKHRARPRASPRTRSTKLVKASPACGPRPKRYQMMMFDQQATSEHCRHKDLQATGDIAFDKRDY